MKTIILFIFALAFAGAARAADPVVKVNSLTDVVVNGSPAGGVVDVLANSTAPNIRARLLDALIVYVTDRENSTAQDKEKQFAERWKQYEQLSAVLKAADYDANALIQAGPASLKADIEARISKAKK